MYISLEEALTRGHGTWRSFTCPDHDDNSPSARVNTETGRWVCMVCGTRGKKDNYDIPEKHVLNRVRRLVETPVELTESYLDLFDSDGPGPYWSQRYTPEACKHFRLGYDADKDCSVYPIRTIVGTVLGLVHRTDKPKYKYPRGVATSQLLFNYHEIEPQSVITVVEGAPDVIALWEAGIPAVGTFGARLLPTQLNLLTALQPTKVLLAFDQDRAGRKGGKQAVHSLNHCGFMAERIIWSDEKDVGEMTIERRQEVFKKYL